MTLRWVLACVSALCGAVSVLAYAFARLEAAKAQRALEEAERILLVAEVTWARVRRRLGLPVPPV